jgi:Tfp pilus assembly protein PilO
MKLTTDIMQRVMVILIVSAVTALATGITTAYSGAKDGTYALEKTEQHDRQLDSLYNKCGIIDVQLINIYKELTDTKDQFDRLDSKIDKIYELLITMK